MIAIWELIIQFSMRAPPDVVTVFTAKICDVICRLRRGRRGFGDLFFTYTARDVFVMSFGGIRCLHDFSPCPWSILAGGRNEIRITVHRPASGFVFAQDRERVA